MEDFDDEEDDPFDNSGIGMPDDFECRLGRGAGAAMGAAGNDGAESSASGSDAFDRRRRGARRVQDSPHRGDQQQQGGGGVQYGHGANVAAGHDLGNDDDDDDDLNPPALGDCSVTAYRDYDASFLGQGIESRPPAFAQTPGSGWHSFKHFYGDGSEERLFIPSRAMVVANIPIELWTPDATRFKDFATPTVGAARATSIAALIGLIYTPLSKGFISGRHEERQREGDGADGGRGRRGPERVWRYMYIPNVEEEPNLSAPMFCFALEKIYALPEDGEDGGGGEQAAADDDMPQAEDDEDDEDDREQGEEEGEEGRDATDDDAYEPCAIRLWHFVFDEEHSTSALVRQLMDEVLEERNNSGIAHSSANQRRGGAAADARRARALSGGVNPAAVELGAYCGTQWLRIVSERDWLNALACAAGQSDTSSGRHCMDFEARLPVGSLNARIRGHKRLGGMHPASPEWLMNAKRAEALQAGLVYLNGKPMNVDHEQLNPQNYFTQDGCFTIPEHVANRHGFYIMTDPSVTNPFDAPMPFTIRTTDKPGVDLMALYRDVVHPKVKNLSSPELQNSFYNMATSVDQTVVGLLRGLTEAIATYDTVEMSDDDRRQLDKMGTTGFASYGATDDKADVIEPRQRLKEITASTQTIIEKLISPWVFKRRTAISQKFSKFNDATAPEEKEKAEAEKAEFQNRHSRVMRDLAEMHLAQMEFALKAPKDRPTISAGSLAIYDGLQNELKMMPNGTANIGHAMNMQMMDKDRTVWSSVHNWIMSFFENDCFSTCTESRTHCPRTHARVCARMH